MQGNYHDAGHINEVMNRDISQKIPVTTIDDLKYRANVNDQTAYIIADAFTANPYQLLGQVVEVRKTNGVCPANLIDGKSLNFEFSAFPLTGFKIDSQAKLSKPELRGSIIVDKKLCVQVSFLSFLEAQLDQKSSFSLVLMDQVKGTVDFHDSTWREAVVTWQNQNPDKMNDDDICYIYVVTGFVQKNIIKKKYYEFETGTKGGAFGININGKLSTSSDEYSLDIVFGLTPAIIKRPGTSMGIRGITFTDFDYIASVDELKLFARINGAETRIHI